jgi:hypothetical protein
VVVILETGSEGKITFLTKLAGSWDKDGTAGSGVKEVRRTRMDPAALLFEQIAVPIMSLPSNKPLKASRQNQSGDFLKK